MNTFSHDVITLLALLFLETMLGFDNLVFISLAVAQLPTKVRNYAKLSGLTAALLIRLICLQALTLIATLKEPLLTMQQFAVSPADLLFVCGGIFLIYHATREMHQQLVPLNTKKKRIISSNWQNVGLRIALLDILFSLDSMMTAIGLTENYTIIVLAIALSMCMMLLGSHWCDRLIHQQPTLKLLAIAFIMMIGIVLTAEGMHCHIPRGYLYSALCFSLLFEMLQNIHQPQSAKKLIATVSSHKTKGLRRRLERVQSPHQHHR